MPNIRGAAGSTISMPGLIIGCVLVAFVVLGFLQQHMHKRQRRTRYHPSLQLQQSSTGVLEQLEKRKEDLRRYINKLKEQLAVREDQLRYHDELEEIVTSRVETSHRDEKEWKKLMKAGKKVHGGNWNTSIGDEPSLRLSKRASWREQPSHELPEVRANLRRILLLSEVARCKADYEFLDNYIQNVKYFRELPPRDRLRFLKAAKGIELDDGDALFRIGDRADAFYCIMFGTMSVVMDFSRMAAPTLNEFEEIMNRARVHSSFLNPGGKVDMSHEATYVIRTMKPLEVFGDVGLLLEEQQRTASVVATETTLLMQIDRDTFMALRARNMSRELRQHYFGFYEAILCVPNAVFSVLVSSPSAILYRVDRVDFRQIVLKDATTEQMLRQEAIGLSARADITSVMRDLKRETKWKQYKQELVDSVFTRHEEEHVPIMGPRPNLGGYHTAREPKFTLPKLSTSPRGSQTGREVPGVSSGRLRRVQKPLLDNPRRSHGHDGGWLDISSSSFRMM
ncbi:hypothetical protein AM588_10009472 [Phytophthora nicotianae]|uniref:Cyclic nucleotide-binding domain-containing protein n=1 Tax=Phytophthora nicotianae TaxID=4792 RepID=A0A0W8DUC9_PHYNI|nr:hypothetical protein AM588_10009472 [Phytophthora nicotianae]